MHGFKTGCRNTRYYYGVASVQNLVKCIRGVGVDVEDLVFEALASSEACLTEDDKMAGTILADIGGAQQIFQYLRWKYLAYSSCSRGRLSNDPGHRNRLRPAL